MKKLSCISVDIEVDTDALDIALGKAKELNRELLKAKALLDELVDYDNANEAERRRSRDGAINFMEMLRREPR